MVGGREETAGTGAARRFAEALRELYEAADRPLYRTLVHQGQKQLPPVRLKDSTLSEWFNGVSVPADASALRFLVAYLQSRVKDGGPRRSEHEWERMRREAQRERRASRGGRPGTDPSALSPGDTAERLPTALPGLPRILRQATDDLPYRQRGPARVRLSAVHVRPSVAAAPAEPAHPWDREDAHEPFDARKEPLRISGSAQPWRMRIRSSACLYSAIGRPEGRGGRGSRGGGRLSRLSGREIIIYLDEFIAVPVRPPE